VVFCDHIFLFLECKLLLVRGDPGRLALGFTNKSSRSRGGVAAAEELVVVVAASFCLSLATVGFFLQQHCRGEVQEAFA
jgi:hypothetical protein